MNNDYQATYPYTHHPDQDIEHYQQLRSLSQALPSPKQSALAVYNHRLDLPLLEHYINWTILYIFFCVLILLFNTVSGRFIHVHLCPLHSLFTILCLEFLRLLGSQLTIDFPYQFSNMWEQSHIPPSSAPPTEAESWLPSPSYLLLLSTALNIRTSSPLANPLFSWSHCLPLLPSFTSSNQVLKYLTLVIFHGVSECPSTLFPIPSTQGTSSMPFYSKSTLVTLSRDIPMTETT